MVAGIRATRVAIDMPAAIDIARRPSSINMKRICSRTTVAVRCPRCGRWRADERFAEQQLEERCALLVSERCEHDGGGCFDKGLMLRKWWVGRCTET